MTLSVANFEKCQQDLAELDQSLESLETVLSGQDASLIIERNEALASSVNEFSVDLEKLVASVGGHEVPFADALTAVVGKDEARQFLSKVDATNQKQKAMQRALKSVTDMNFKLLGTLSGQSDMPGKLTYDPQGSQGSAQGHLGFSASA